MKSHFLCVEAGKGHCRPSTWNKMAPLKNCDKTQWVRWVWPQQTQSCEMEQKLSKKRLDSWLNSCSACFDNEKHCEPAKGSVWIQYLHGPATWPGPSSTNEQCYLSSLVLALIIIYPEELSVLTWFYFNGKTCLCLERFPGLCSHQYPREADFRLWFQARSLSGPIPKALFQTWQHPLGMRYWNSLIQELNGHSNGKEDTLTEWTSSSFQRVLFKSALQIKINSKK